MVTTSQGNETQGPPESEADAARILVVDDEDIIRSLLVEILTSEGYAVTSAADGKEAIGLLQQQGQSFDLVITDMVMPGVSGIEVLQAAFGVDPNYPVIMITGYPSVDTAVRLVSLGAADYITKPFNVDLIKVTVAKVIQMSKMRSPLEAVEDSDGHDGAAPIDKVTGAYTAPLFRDMVRAEVGRSSFRKHLFSLMIVEIDSFESFTGQDGTDTGNQTLQAFAAILRKECKPGDVLGRLGPSQMGILFPETNRDEAESRGRRFKALAQLKFTFSGGLVSYPRDGGDVRALLKTAQSAMEFAKHKGGDQIFMPQ